MTDNNSTVKSRRARINRMKKIIVIFLIFLILMPTVLCIILFIRLNRVQKQLNTLIIARNSPMLLAEQEETTGDFYIEAFPIEIVKETQTEPESSTEVIPTETTLLLSDQIEYSDEELVAMALEEGRKVVYLTFDDGPSESTPLILDVLDQYNVKATFFTIGNVNSDMFYLYNEILDRGHSLGMHSYSHVYSQIYANLANFDDDFNKISTQIEEVTGQVPYLYRFPGGSSNLVSAIPMTEFIKYLNNKNVIYFDWNVSVQDAEGRLLTADELVNNAFKDIDKKDVCCVLMHDSANLPTTVEALSVIIEKLQKMDALILPITETTQLFQHIKSDSVN